MTFKDMNDKDKKDSVFNLMTPMDKAGIIAGVIVNVALIILYLVMKYC